MKSDESRGRNWLWSVVSIFFQILLLFPGRTVAAPGDLDKTFNVPSGYVHYEPGCCARDVAVDGQGRIVVVGNIQSGNDTDVVVLRYLPSGILDKGFGNGTGIMQFSGTAGGSDEARAVAVQKDNKIVVVGSSFNGMNNDILVMRLMESGNLDLAFAGGTGYLLYDGPAGYIDDGYGVAIQEDGKIVVAGASNTGPFTDAVVLRFDKDGRLDTTTFGGGDGAVTYHGLSNESAVARDVAITEDGKIVVAGEFDFTTDLDVLVLQYLPNGMADTQFGGGDGSISFDAGPNRKSRNDYARAVVIDEQGRILVTGTTDNDLNNDLLVARFHEDGGLDIEGFGNGSGFVAYDGPAGFIDNGKDLALQPDGKIVVVGWSHNGPNADLVVLRYTEDGALDKGGFGHGKGVVDFRDDSYGYAEAAGVAIQKDGRIVVAGESNDFAGHQDMLTLRFDGVDPLPLPQGQVTFTYPAGRYPVFSNDLELLRPVGLGSAAFGNEYLELSVGLPPFAGEIKVYLGVESSLFLPENLLLINESDELLPFSKGLLPWRRHVAAYLKESLFGRISLKGWPPGRLTFYLLVAPEGQAEFDSSQGFYLWSTTLALP